MPASAIGQAMEWEDGEDEVDKRARKTRACVTTTPRLAAAQELQFKTAAEDAQHKRTCGKDACAWCKSVDFLDKHKAAFQLVDDHKKRTTQAKGLAQKDKLLLGMSWLGKAHRGDEVFLGCIACHALQEKRLTNAFASFAISATRLFASTGKPHHLLRHADSAVHASAVSKFLGDSAGASW